jgi:hypothetical protein
MILLIPVLTLFTGSVTLASTCAKMAAGMECGGTVKAQGSCMKIASHKECDGCGQKCHKRQTGKDEQKGKDDGGCCMDPVGGYPAGIECRICGYARR